MRSATPVLPSESRANRSIPFSLKRCNKMIVWGLVLTLLLVALVMYFQFHAQPAVDTSVIKASGRIEANESHVASVIAGRIDKVLVKEGDRVHKGQELITMNDEQLRPLLKASDSGISTAEQLLDKARMQVSALKQQMAKVSSMATKSASAPVNQMAMNMPGMDKAGMDAASKSGKNAKEGSKIGGAVAAPFKMLMKPLGAINPANGIKKEIAAAQENAVAMQKAAFMKQAEAMKAQARMQAKMQLGSMQLMLNQANAQVLMAQGEVTKAHAQHDQLISKNKQFKIVSDVDGIVSSCMVAAGDVVPAGRILITVSDPSSTYMRGFIPEGQIANVKIGERVNVTLDSGRAKKQFVAHVSEIDPAASFTPENVYFQDDRVRQVFGMKMRLDAPDGSAKPGMPCDAEIFTKSEATDT